MSAADLFFVDTNVLLYSADASERQKRDAAHRWLEMLWASGTGRLSWQVLNEFTVNALRTLKAPQAKVRETVAVFAEWQPICFSLGLLQRSWHWMDEWHVPDCDTLLVDAAE